jgi:hypothetical protein
LTKISLPVEENPEFIAGISYSLAQKFGEELGEYIHNIYAADNQPDWFHQLRLWRESQNQPFVFDDFRDPRFILTEQQKEDSPLRQIIPGWNTAWFNNATALKKRLNTWSHHRAKPSIQNLKALAELMATLVSGFQIEDDTKALVSRCKAILAGTYVPNVADKQDVVAEAAPEVREEVDRYEEVPPIGSRWLKPLPTRKLKLIKSTGDLLDSGRSVKDQLGPGADEIMRKWFVYFPAGGEVFVDDKTGAVVAFKKGDAHLIGWFGVEPDYSPDKIRGFFLPKEYQYKDQDVLDTASGQRLLSTPDVVAKDLIGDIAAQVSEGEYLFITDYGDVAIELEDGGFKKITEADAGSWFPGALPL